MGTIRYKTCEGRQRIHCALYKFPVPLAVKGRPEKIYLDHGSTSAGAAWWFRKVMYEEKLNQFTIRQDSAKQVTVVVDLGNASLAKFHIAERSHLFTKSTKTYVENLPSKAVHLL